MMQEEFKKEKNIESTARQEEVRQAKKFSAVKTELKVTGVRFDGYSAQKGGMQHNSAQEVLKVKDQIASLQNPEEPADEEQKDQGRYKAWFLAGMTGIGAEKEKDAWVNQKHAKGKVRSRKAAVKEKQNDADTEKVATSQSDKEKAAPSGESKDNLNNEYKSDFSPDFTPEQKPGMSREELIKRCGVREKNRFGESAVKSSGQTMEHALAEDPEAAASKPGVAPKDEGKNKKNSSDGDKKSKKKKKSEDDKRKRGADKQKQTLMMNYVIKELIHQEGQDPDSFQHLTGQMVMIDLGKIAGFLGKKLLKALGWLLIGIFTVLFLIMVTLLPVLCVATFLMSPVSYFTGIHEQAGDLKSNPQYIKNVVQEMYTDFYGQIDTFMDGDPNNEVWYKYGTYSNADDVIAVYLAQVSSIETDKEESSEEQEDTDYYPEYLLIDTKEERQLLDQVFREFNSIGYEKIKVTVEGEDGEEKQEYAQKMTVSCLTVVLWREEHEKDLSEEQRKLLEVLLEQAETSPISGISGPGSFDGNAVPITELVIPEGVDEKLVYLAGFIKAEAGNQSEKGKIAVGYVILNRAGGSGGNVKGVLTAPYQFSCYIPYHTVEKYLSEYAAMTDAQRGQDACWRAAEAVYYGTAENPIGNMKFYCNPKACSVGEEEQWNRIRAKNREDEIIIIGDHVFCKNCW